MRLFTLFLKIRQLERKAFSIFVPMLKRQWLCALYCSLACCCLAQQTKVDSLFTVLKRVPVDNDTAHILVRAQLLNSISANYCKPMKAYAECRTYGRQSLALFQQLQHTRGTAQALGNIAFSYAYEGRLPEATDTFLLCYHTWEQARDTAKMTYIISTVAANYYEMPEQLDKALLYAKRCVDLTTRANRPHGLCACSHLLGDIYDRLGKPDSAAVFVQNALQILEKTDNIPGKAPLYLTLARIEERKQHYDKENAWLAKAEDTYKSHPETVVTDNVVNVLLARSRCFIHLGQWAAAERYLDKIADLLPQIQDLSYHERYYLDRSRLAEQQHRPADALRYLKLHLSARDSVSNLENTRRITEIQLNHEFKEKQAQTAAEQARALALRDARAQQQKWVFIAVLLGLLSALGLFFYGYRQRQERRRTELLLSNLRAQINPHFIFNCLNSIYRYTKERDTDTAARYLQKFSSLLRLVLENSRSEKITLAKDLEALQLYVDIEALRFKEKLQFSLIIDPDIDPSFLQIPGMLIQPHVENAIWHGLMHRKEGGQIQVRISLPAENLLHVEIEDNGIGRVAAAELESKSALTQKSLGQKITHERLKATGKLAHLETIDLQNPSGTRVIMEIPL